MNALPETMHLLQTDDASKWAKAFCAMEKNIAGIDLDEGWVLGWFANAIETAKMVQEKRNLGADPTGCGEPPPFWSIISKSWHQRQPSERAMIAAVLLLSTRGDFYLRDAEGWESPASSLNMEEIFERLVIEHDRRMTK